MPSSAICQCDFTIAETSFGQGSVWEGIRPAFPTAPFTAFRRRAQAPTIIVYNGGGFPPTKPRRYPARPSVDFRYRRTFSIFQRRTGCR